MNRNDFNRFVSEGAVPGRDDIEGIRELTDLFPWFHSAHLVLLRSLKESFDVKFETQLKSSALHVADREVLYHYLFMQTQTHEEVKAETAPAVAKSDTEAVAAVPEEKYEPAEVHEVHASTHVIEEISHDEAGEVSEEHVPDVTEEIHSEEVSISSSHEDTSQMSREDLLAEIESRLHEIENKDTGQTVSLETKEVTQPENIAATEEETKADEASTDAGQETITMEEIQQPAESVAEEEIKVEGPETTVAELENKVEGPEMAVPEVEVKTEVSEITAAEAVPATEIEEETVFEIELDPNYTLSPEKEEQAGFEDEEDLLELVTAEEAAVVPEPVSRLSPADLIDKFIRENPRIERTSVPDLGPVRDLSEESAVETGSFITETLARIYVNQGYYSKAINIYEKLALKYPEKSAYFASRIEKIKELIK